jgi:hypothetical protein
MKKADALASRLVKNPYNPRELFALNVVPPGVRVFNSHVIPRTFRSEESAVRKKTADSHR